MLLLVARATISELKLRLEKNKGKCQWPLVTGAPESNLHLWQYGKAAVSDRPCKMNRHMGAETGRW